MRGQVDPQSALFSYVSAEERIPKDHPLRSIKAHADAILRSMNARFEAMYEDGGRPSIPPERLLKATLLIALHSIRSDRLFCEVLGYNILYRWFLDMDLEEAAFDHSSFSKNRARLIEHDIAKSFFAGVIKQARRERLLSDEHFTVDGTLIEAWASFKSFKRKDGTPPHSGEDGTGMVDFRGEKRTNATHQLSTDPQAKLMRKGNGQPAKLSFGAQALMENRHGLLIDVRIGGATAAEVAAVQPILDRRRQGRSGLRTLGARHRPAHRAHRGPHHPRAGRAHHAPCRLWREPAKAQAHRRDIRLDEKHRWSAPHPLCRYCQDAARSLPDRGCLQLDAPRAIGASDGIAPAQVRKTNSRSARKTDDSSNSPAVATTRAPTV